MDEVNFDWKGKPVFIPYMSGVISYMIFGLAMSYLFLRITTEEYFLALSPVYLLCFWLVVGLPIRRYLMWLKLEYFVNHTEVIIKSGVFKSKIIKIMVCDIQRIEQHKNFVDDLASQKSRTIYLYTTLIGAYSEFGGNFTSLTPDDGRSSIHGYYSIKSVQNGEQLTTFLNDVWQQIHHNYPTI